MPTETTLNEPLRSGRLVRRGVFSRDWPGLLAAIAFMPLFLFVFLLTAERRDETLAQWTLRNFGRPFLDEPNTPGLTRRANDDAS